MHWGHDIGAAWLTRELARLGGDTAVLGRASRLVLDLNRSPEEPSFIVADTHDGAVSFNQAVSGAERAARTARFFEPYHAVVSERVATFRPRLLFSVHSFTWAWHGVPRAVEAGVLFDRHDDHALALVEALRAEGFRAEPNEPYSGKVGLIYSAARHGQEAGIPYLELEVRQDLLATRARAEAVAARVRRALGACGW
jgi:predicted N-formylglutamate amidohydrolase